MIEAVSTDLGKNSTHPWGGAIDFEWLSWDIIVGNKVGVLVRAQMGERGHRQPELGRF